MRIFQQPSLSPLPISFFALSVLLLFYTDVSAQESTLSPTQIVYLEKLLQQDTPVAIVHMLCVVVLKIVAFIIGYLIVKLGHDTFVKGITGEFDFGFSGRGVSAKLKSAAPGTFFVLAGAAIILWGLFVSKPYDFSFTEKMQQHLSEQAATAAKPEPSPRLP